MGSEFEGNLNSFADGTQWFLRAFAENSMGRTYGSVKKFNFDPRDDSQLDTNLSFAGTFIGSGKNSYSWAYDEVFEWIYFGSVDQGGIWFWIEEFGWLWSTESAWPYCWSGRNQGWLYYLGEKMGEPSFLDHETYHTLNSIPLPEINQPVILQPIPRTLEPELVNGKIQVWAELLTDGGETPDEVGFIISQMITDWEDHPSTEIKLASLENGYFEVLLDESLADGTYYIRSFASNSAGKTIGSVKRVRVSEKRRIPFDAYSIGADWYRSDWFGIFKGTEFQWIFHQDFGWLYHGPIEPHGIWFWKENMGWLWSNSEQWPFVWDHQHSSWHYFSGTFNGDSIFGITDYPNTKFGELSFSFEAFRKWQSENAFIPLLGYKEKLFRLVANLRLFFGRIRFFVFLYLRGN